MHYNEATLMLLVATAMLTGGEGSDKYFEAMTKQAHVDAMAQQFERRMLSERQRQVAGNLFIVGKLLIDRQVTWQITFP